LPMPSGSTRPFCRRCQGRIIRSRRWQAIKRAVLPLFIEDCSDE
jgi:hypothetical protein